MKAALVSFHFDLEIATRYRVERPNSFTSNTEYILLDLFPPQHLQVNPDGISQIPELFLKSFNLKIVKFQKILFLAKQRKMVTAWLSLHRSEIQNTRSDN